MIDRQPTAVSQRARRSGVLHGLEEVGAMAVLVVLVAAALYAASEWILWRS